MAKTLHLIFLWHMHQPPYADPQSGKALMPWVRLHAVKGYYDMASLMEEFPGLRMTFNFTPILVSQFGTFGDVFLDYTLMPASELSPEDKEFLLANFFLCHPETMIRPYPRYWELFKKRGKRSTGQDVRHHLASFSQGDLLDLQVWFNLTWFGFSAEGKDPNIAELKEKERSFTEEDKAYIVTAQRRIQEEIIPLYRRLRDRGQIEISLSPFYHPILPLLYDSDLARRCKPGVILPPRFNHPEDARAQIEKAVAFGENTWGTRPAGMWPPEGSVSPEIASLMADEGIAWAASDEAILLRSIQGKREDVLYSPYVISSGTRKIAMIFRDRGLSNAISFTYHKQPPEDAVLDFAKRLETILVSSPKDEPCAAVILDGENPWEYYPGHGAAFLRGLFRLLSEGPLKTETPSAYLAGHPPRTSLSALGTGSWIDGTFDIWIGQDEDNKGWGLLKKTRDFLSSYLSAHPDVAQGVRDRAWEHIYQAEASDWFWWYGDEFFTEQDREFDHLFRSHLMAVYQILTGDTPQFLQEPVCTHEAYVPESPPTSFITPRMEGEISNYFEWHGAGLYAPTTEGALRFRGEGLFSRLLYGFDRENMYLCLEPWDGKGLDRAAGLTLHLHILHGSHGIEHKASIEIPSSAGVFPIPVFRAVDGVTFSPSGEAGIVAVKKVIEISLSFARLGLHEGERVNFVVEVKDRDSEVDRYPRQGYISFLVPTERFEREMWSV